MTDIVERLKTPPFGTETSERTLMASAAEEIERLRAKIDAGIRVLSDDRMPLQSRINDARAILAR